MNNRNGKWVGPYSLDNWDVKKILDFVRDFPVGPSRPFVLAQVKKYLCPKVSSHTFVCDVSKDLRKMFHAWDTRMTEIIAHDEPRANSTKMKRSILDEIEDLMSRGCLKVVILSHISLNANVFPCKYVLAIKYDETDAKKYKARFVLGGHRDIRNTFNRHTSRTVQPSSARLLSVDSEINDFDLCSEDTPQVYTRAPNHWHD